MHNIAIVGGGQLGSRHLQACASLGGSTTLFLIDPSQQARETSRERYAAVTTSKSPKLQLAAAMEQCPEELDLVIVATTADIRLNVMKNIVSSATVKNWLLEKVLFQKLEEYGEAIDLLGEKADNVWVNCAQRLWPFFQDLKQNYACDERLEILVTGSNWGLGCNAVHNTDIAAFLWDGPLQHRAVLDVETQDSKRPGFKEFTGLLETVAEAGGVLRQISYSTGDAPFTIVASHPDFMKIWDVSVGLMNERGVSTGWNWEQSELSAPFQSNLTAKVAKDILSGEDCGLPGLLEATRVHVGTLEALLKAAAANGQDMGSTCPVT